MIMKFKDKIVLQGCREEYCEYGPLTGILRWVYDVLGESYLTRLTCLCQKEMGAEAGDLILFFGWLGVFYFLASGW